MNANKLLFLGASVTGLVASILAMAIQPTPLWILLIVMVSAWLFFFTFATVAMFRLPVHPSRLLTLALIFFAAGAFGNFIISLDIYLLDPTLPYFGFLRNSVVSATALGAGAILLTLDAFIHPPPLVTKLVFFFIVTSVISLLTGSVIAFKGDSHGGKIANTVGFAILFLGSLVNLLS